MRKRAIAFLLLAVTSSQSQAASAEKLIFAMDIIRHGDRTPIFIIPTTAHDWPQGLGQLTATGMQQEYQLGLSARSRYITHTHLLPSTYLGESLYVRSSDIDRTLMSAQSFLLGLYPLGTGPRLPNTPTSALPGGFQPIPIHTVSKEHETLLNATSDTPTLKELTKTYVYSTPEWKAKLAEVQPKFAAWSKALGVTITDLYQLKSIGDTLSINQRYHIALPAGLSEADANTIIEAGRFAFVTTYKNPIIGKTQGEPLFKAISDDLQAASTGTSPLKYKLISGHDSTLLSVMSAMGAPLNETPKYASDLNIELYQAKNQMPVVKMTFNHHPVFLPACGNRNCTLSEFVALANAQ